MKSEVLFSYCRKQQKEIFETLWILFYYKLHRKLFQKFLFLDN